MEWTVLDAVDFVCSNEFFFENDAVYCTSVVQAGR